MRTLTDADADRHAAEIAEQGYTIVEAAFDSVFGKKVLDALDAVIERRVGIADNYCAGMTRQQENQQLGVPREIARTFDTRLARLCGYGTYHGLIGHIDKTDPLRLLDDDDADDAMLWDAG